MIRWIGIGLIGATLLIAALVLCEVVGAPPAPTPSTGEPPW